MGGEGAGESKGSEMNPCFIIAETKWFFLDGLVGVWVAAVVVWDGIGRIVSARRV